MVDRGISSLSRLIQLASRTHQFRHIGNDCKASSHVSVKRAVSDCEF